MFLSKRHISIQRCNGTVDGEIEGEGEIGKGGRKRERNIEERDEWRKRERGIRRKKRKKET